MTAFSVLILTAAPLGAGGEAGGAFVKIDGREALLRSVELFVNRDGVNEVQVVVAPEALEEAKRKYGPHLSFSGVKLFAGGHRWIEQIAASAERISPECTHVLVHDAARPATPHADIDAVMTAAGSHEAVALTAPVRGPLIEVDEGGAPMAVHPAGDFLTLLTPQAFSRAKFAELAHSRAEIHPSQWSLVRGSPLNLRVNGPGDAGLVKTMLGMIPKAKVKPPSSPFEEAQW